MVALRIAQVAAALESYLAPSLTGVPVAPPARDRITRID